MDWRKERMQDKERGGREGLRRERQQEQKEKEGRTERIEREKK